jgi:hypothetical protein
MDKCPTAQLLFFWDYDTQWGADRSRLNGGKKHWGHLEFEHTERLLDLHAQFRVPACFAIVGAAAVEDRRPYGDPDQIRRIHRMGHEIASHSHRHEWLPGLNESALLETLRSSKDALEQCIGDRVVSFVPPYNQPVDLPARWSISLSERREAGSDRTDLRRLCDGLRHVGYQFCRVAYRSLYQRLAEEICGRRMDRPARSECIGGITCVRLNTAAGFTAHATQMVNRTSRHGGMVVVYGHPHSLRSGNSQDERWLVPFLQLIQRKCEEGCLSVILPRDLVQ